MTDDLRHRLDAVERAVTDGETEFESAADVAAVDARLTAVEARLDEVDSRLAELDAATQAVRGYLRGVDGLTEDVERQASLALSKAEAVEAHVFDADTGLAVERLPTSADSHPTNQTGDVGPDERRPSGESAPHTQGDTEWLPADGSDLADRPAQRRLSEGGVSNARLSKDRTSEESLVARLRDVL